MDPILKVVTCLSTGNRHANFDISTIKNKLLTYVTAWVYHKIIMPPESVSKHYRKRRKFNKGSFFFLHTS